ncbi:MAG: type II toxin-antitoxin system VapC family toxin [Acidobacteria bacterium]|jgi:predicted nucleic acid-binding protein|nr:type II toxin-antitoxin system VapC family toxin [Acidobacteriota bacterium]MBP8273660.1 type II toxin-antitoxin system VapC family toxin [Acidobacteriota bacterium]
MSVFVDTSGFYAWLVGSEAAHKRVAASFENLLGSGRALWTTSFVVVETMALLQHRIGTNAARTFDEDVLPVMRVAWVDDALYRQGTERLWRADRRQLSLVDCVSFAFMKQQGLTTAVALDPHFEQAGFSLLPGKQKA